MTTASRPVRPPDVSVIIPTWKAATFIGAAVDSALASVGVSVQAVVVDDASPDNTFAVLSDLAANDDRILVDRLAANGGPSAARNRAMDLASGRYLAVLDADDTIDPDRLSRLCGIADQTQADIVVDNMWEVDETGALIGAGRFIVDDAFAEQRPITLFDWIHHNQTMKRGTCLGYLKPVFRRATLDRLGVRYDPGLRNSEDYYIVAHLLAMGAKMMFCPQPGYRYRRAVGSTSSRLYPRDTSAWLVAEEKFMNTFGDRVTAAERKELETRARILHDVHHWSRAYEALKAKRLGAFTSILASDPSATRFTLTWFARAGVGKLARAVRGGA